jgi:acyl-CoA synthetase (AMP-forming)/AMP-acid ligase II
VGPLLAAFERTVRDRGDAVAICSRGEGLEISFTALAERAAGRARGLALPSGLPVGLAAGNTAAFVELFFALRRLELPVVAMDASLPREKKLELCRRLGIATLLHRDGGGESAGDGLFLSRLEDFEPSPAPPGTALVKLTSGCTGEPAGACFGEEQLCAGIRQIAAGQDLSGRDRVLVAIPLSHSYGFDNGVLSLAVAGTPLVLEPDYFPRPLLRALREAEITVFPAVPPMIRTLASGSWPGDLPLRRVICAAGPLPVSSARAFRERSGLAVHQFYGCTEAGGICFERSPEDPDATGTVGHPLPGVEVALGEERRVEVRSRACFTAYLGRGAEQPAGVVAPGDQGEWTPAGRLRLTGRSADIIKVGGRKVHAAAIEEALRAIDGVDDAAVIGVADPDHGERAIAFVVSRRQRLDTSRLPPGLTPREVRNVPALPYTARGKLDREALRRLAAGEGEQRSEVRDQRTGNRE